MMNIVIFGVPGSASLELIHQKLNKLLAQCEIAYDITLVSDMKVFLDKSLDSIPAVQIDNELVCFRKRNTFNYYLKEIIKKILQKVERGSLKKISFPVFYEQDLTNALFYAHHLCTDLQTVMDVCDLRTKNDPDQYGEQLQKTLKQIESDWIGSLESSTPITFRSFEGSSINHKISQFASRNTSLILQPLSSKKTHLEDLLQNKKLSKTPIYLIPKSDQYHTDPSLINLINGSNTDKESNPKIYSRHQYLNINESELETLVASNNPLIIT